MSGLIGDFLRSSWKLVGKPPLLGKEIYVHPKLNPSDFIWKGYHGTRLGRIEDQLVKGEFENRDKLIYLAGHPLEASKYLVMDYPYGITSRFEKTPVILQIASRNLFRKDNRNGTYYFPAGPDQKVFICRAWEISEEFKALISKP